MRALAEETRLTSFLVKVASRCNLDCDYCYVYHHADQSWRSMPAVLSQQDRDAFAAQLAAYVAYAGLQRCVVVFHGGEPLLMGSGSIAAFARQLRAAVGEGVQIDISMQTNGLLLTREVVDELGAADIGISLSLDGPKEANDLHRVSRRGRSSFDKTIRAMNLLKASPAVFAGVIAVIDPRVHPRQLLQFFDEHAVPRLDFLLPDAHHTRPPPGRGEQPDIYERWLIDAFDTWFDDYPHLQLRTFEALLDAVAGLPSQTDAFGFGDVSLITVETDGTYHDLDVLKVVGPGATRLSGRVQDTPIAEIARSPTLAAHRALLRKDGLCASCQQCDVVDICGGGAVPHRHGLLGFKNPTVYCREMRALIRHVRARLLKGLAVCEPKALAPTKAVYAGSMAEFERAEKSGQVTTRLWTEAIAAHAVDLRQALLLFCGRDEQKAVADAANELLLTGSALQELAEHPGTVAWSRAMLAIGSGRSVHAVDGTVQHRDADYLMSMLAAARSGATGLEVHAEDAWLRRPFGNAIFFEDRDVAEKATPLLHEALRIVESWRPSLARELRFICRAVQFIRDPGADPEKIVSFSDNAVPGALYVSIMQRNQLVDAYDLADSLIHEYRHQKLYLMERLSPMVEPTSQKVVSPWREDLRPPAGLFHAIFVFVELRRFWMHVRSLGIERLKRRAENQLADTNAHLDAGLQTLRACTLTPAGVALAAVLTDAARE